MTYQVLARRWRPQRFEDLVGQEVVVRTLHNALASRQVAHAYLFSGLRGVGKTTAARLLAKALNCEKGPTPEPCGVCVSCEEITAGRSPDVQEIDAASNRGIDEVRRLIEVARVMPMRDRYRVFILDEAHQLTAEAFNALLKLLEEPPAHVVFILASTARHKFPATILSRCQQLDFRPIPLELIVARLTAIAAADSFTLEPDAAQLVARAAEGSLRDALSLLDRVRAFADGAVTQQAISEVLGLPSVEVLLSLWAALEAGDVARALTIVRDEDAAGRDPRALYERLIELLQALLLLACDPQAPVPFSGAHRDAIAASAARLGVPVVLRLAGLALEQRSLVASADRPGPVVAVAIGRLSLWPRLVRVEALLSGAAPEPPATAGRGPAAPPAAGAAAPPAGAPPVAAGAAGRRQGAPRRGARRARSACPGGARRHGDRGGDRGFRAGAALRVGAAGDRAVAARRPRQPREAARRAGLPAQVRLEGAGANGAEIAGAAGEGRGGRGGAACARGVRRPHRARRGADMNIAKLMQQAQTGPGADAEGARASSRSRARRAAAWSRCVSTGSRSCAACTIDPQATTGDAVVDARGPRRRRAGRRPRASSRCARRRSSGGWACRRVWQGCASGPAAAVGARAARGARAVAGDRAAQRHPARPPPDAAAGRRAAARRGALARHRTGAALRHLLPAQRGRPLLRCAATRGATAATICVVEDPLNAWAVEATAEFRGLYHVLLGTLDPLHGIGPEELTIAALVERVRGGEVREVIIATNPTVEGEATAHYLVRALHTTGVSVTRIAFGLPAGGEISYADQVTLSRALAGRRGMD